MKNYNTLKKTLYYVCGVEKNNFTIDVDDTVSGTCLVKYMDYVWVPAF